MFFLVFGFKSDVLFYLRNFRSIVKLGFIVGLTDLKLKGDNHFLSHATSQELRLIVQTLYIVLINTPTPVAKL